MIRKNQKVFIACDSNFSYGSGHVMRSITLGASLRDEGFEVTLFCKEIPKSLVERANQFGLLVKERQAAQANFKVADDVINFSNSGDVVVFDGYLFDHEAIRSVSEANRCVIVIDDNGDLASCAASLIVNQNLHANTDMYQSNRFHPRLLLGTKWALIRPEVRTIRESQVARVPNEVFIAMGGTDPLEITPKISAVLQNQQGLTTVAAGGFLNDKSLTPLEMAQHMAQAQVGVIACGTTTWEGLCLGLPMVGVVVAHNQIEVAKSLHENNLAEYIDCRNHMKVDEIVVKVKNLLSDDSKCRDLAEKGTTLIDGQGARRVAAEISDIVR